MEMTDLEKQRWWNAMDEDQKAAIRANPEFYGRVFQVFGVFGLELVTYQGVEALPETPYTEKGWWCNETV